MLTIHVPQPETPARRRHAAEAPGKPWHRVAGGWLDDHVALRKFVTLCTDCTPRFNPRRHHYEVWRQTVYVMASCTACNAFDPRCRAYIHEALHEQLGETGRRRGRWAS